LVGATFTDISEPIVLPDKRFVLTNFLDMAGASNKFYRVRVVP